jgi:hypothetical protein
MRALALIIALVATTVSAQSNLPACIGGDTSRWRNCSGTINYPNGDRYVGEFMGSKFNGYGTIINTTGFEYVGKFSDGGLIALVVTNAAQPNPDNAVGRSPSYFLAY